MLKFLGNLVWFLLGGLINAICFFVAGLLWCVTIIGIPFGLQCFKIARLMLFPFGKNIKSNFGKHPIANIIWALLFGWEFFLVCAFLGILFCITIIGIPFGKQWFKLAGLALLPFGAKIN